MKNRNDRLVLACVIFATEIVRLVIKILALVGTALNYAHEAEVDKQV